MDIVCYYLYDYALVQWLMHQLKCNYSEDFLLYYIQTNFFYLDKIKI